jgi:hypothetical protein
MVKYIRNIKTQIAIIKIFVYLNCDRNSKKHINLKFYGLNKKRPFEKGQTHLLVKRIGLPPAEQCISHLIPPSGGLKHHRVIPMLSTHPRNTTEKLSFGPLPQMFVSGIATGAGSFCAYAIAPSPTIPSKEFFCRYHTILK